MELVLLQINKSIWSESVSCDCGMTFMMLDHSALIVASNHIHDTIYTCTVVPWPGNSIRIDLPTCVCMYVCTYVYVCMYVCMYVCIHARIHILVN